MGLLLCIAVGQSLGCGGSNPSNTQPTPVPATAPTFSHVVVLVEENHGYSEVIGNASMPYLNQLVSQYGLATQYFANAHPSLPNYLVLTTGQIESTDNNFSGTITDDNVVRELISAGKTWRCYAGSLPTRGYLGGDYGAYVRHHNPFTYLSDVQSDPSQAANIVPFTEFSSDLAADTLPEFAFIVPDVNDDAHDGSLGEADSWLNANIAPLLASPSFQKSGLLIVTFDEGDQSDINHGGGQIATLIVSSEAKQGYQSQTLYQHQSVLRLSLAALGIQTFPGMAANGPDMTEFFQGH
jgi:acid phosphatase